MVACYHILLLTRVNRSTALSQVEWKENNLPVLVDHLKAICDRQVAETHKAVIGRGEWKFEQQYSYLEVPEQLWFQKSQQQRNTHLNKVMTATPFVPSSTSVCTKSQVTGGRT